MLGPDVIAHASHVAFGDEHVLVAAAPLRPVEQNAKIRVGPHHQFNIDAAPVGLKLLCAVNSFQRELRTVVSGLEEPTLARRSQEIVFDLLRLWPVPELLRREVGGLSHLTPSPSPTCHSASSVVRRRQGRTLRSDFPVPVRHAAKFSYRSDKASLDKHLQR